MSLSLSLDPVSTVTTSVHANAAQDTKAWNSNNHDTTGSDNTSLTSIDQRPRFPTVQRTVFPEKAKTHVMCVYVCRFTCLRSYIHVYVCTHTYIHIYYTTLHCTVLYCAVASVVWYVVLCCLMLCCAMKMPCWIVLYVNICMYVCMYVCVYYAHTYIHIYIYVYNCMYIYI